jgi:hypothetical protein
MISFAIKDTVKRMTEENTNALSSSKGQKIIDQVTKINENFSRSIEIKTQNRMAAQ